jgi:hypothetical protein
MKWLARLKKIELAPEVAPTKPTKPSQEAQIGGFVGFVGPGLSSTQKTGGDLPAANDPAPMPTKARVLPMADLAPGAVIDVGTIRPTGLSPKLLAASLALDAQIAALGLLPYAERQHGHDPRGYP